VLEPLAGYLTLAEHLFASGVRYAQGWNFGPPEEDARPVKWLVERLCDSWGEGASYLIDRGEHPHEANYLKLDCSQARTELGWSPRWGLEKTLQSIVEWTQAYQGQEDLLACCRAQIAGYAGEL
jgi:CDP-glucose 4,6-dehydratase